MRDDSQGDPMSQDENQDNYSQPQGSYSIEEHAQREDFGLFDGMLAQDPDQFFQPWQDSPDSDAPAQAQSAAQNLNSNASTQIGVHNPPYKNSWELSIGSTQSYNDLGPQLTESKSESKAGVPLIQEKNSQIHEEAVEVHHIHPTRQQVEMPTHNNQATIQQERDVPEKVDAPAMNTRGRKRDSTQISPDEQREQSQITTSSSSSKPNPQENLRAVDFMLGNTQDGDSPDDCLQYLA